MTTLNHTRSFGCEIELTGLDINQAATALRAVGIKTWDSSTRTMGPDPAEAPPSPPAPIPAYPDNQCGCDSCRYNWAARYGAAGASRRIASEEEIKTAWRVIPDGSVANGCEVVSPILSGDAGLEQLRMVVRALKAAGATVDASCGFHVHVDARDLSAPEVINAVSRYARYEAQIDSFMAPRRRGNQSQWCRTMSVVATNMTTQGDGANLTSVVNLAGGRYYKLNVHAYLRHGTLEFRQHAGTLNIQKMVHWIVFAVQFIEDSRLSAEFVASYQENATNKQLAKLANYIGTNAYLEVWRVASYMGIAENDVSAMFEAMKNKYPIFAEARIDNGMIRFRLGGRPARSELPAVPSGAFQVPTSPAVFDNLPAATKAYLQARTEGYLTRVRRTSSNTSNVLSRT